MPLRGIDNGPLTEWETHTLFTQEPLDRWLSLYPKSKHHPKGQYIRQRREFCPQPQKGDRIRRLHRSLSAAQQSPVLLFFNAQILATNEIAPTLASETLGNPEPRATYIYIVNHGQQKHIYFERSRVLPTTMIYIYSYHIKYGSGGEEGETRRHIFQSLYSEL